MCLCIVRELVPMSPLPLGIEVNLSCKCVKCASLCNEHSDEQVGLGLQGRELGQRWPGFWGWNQVSVFLPSSSTYVVHFSEIWFDFLIFLHLWIKPNMFAKIFSLLHLLSPNINIKATNLLRMTTYWKIVVVDFPLLYFYVLSVLNSYLKICIKY